MDRRREIDDTAKWRQRYLLMSALRVGGFAIALIGLLLMRGGVLVEEPLPAFGVPLLVIGLADALLIPRVMKRVFDRQDGRA